MLVVSAFGALLFWIWPRNLPDHNGKSALEWFDGGELDTIWLAHGVPAGPSGRVVALEAFLEMRGDAVPFLAGSREAQPDR